MNGIILEYKAFFKRKYRSILFIGLLLFKNIYMSGCMLYSINYFPIPHEVFYGWYLPMGVIPIVTILFLLLSFDYISQIKSEYIEELISTTKTGLAKMYCRRFFVMTSLAFIVTLVDYILFMIQALVEGIFYKQYILEGFNSFICYELLVLILIILLSWLISNIKVRMLGILTCLIVSFLIIILLQDEYCMYSDALYEIGDIFYIFSRFTRVAMREHLGYPAGLQEYSKIIGWISFCTISITYIYANKKTRKYIVPFILIPISLFIIYKQPSGIYKPIGCLMSTEDNSLFYDWSYYMNNNYEVKDVEADYYIEEYNINMVLKQVLKAEVTLTFSNATLSEYPMTLYHGYKIENIVDKDGNELEYDRDGDYLKIYSDRGNMDNITICYKGKSATFYANGNNSFLPGFFPYYPMAGYRPIYYKDYQTYNLEQQKDKALYDIEITSSNQMYSNLEEIEHNHFQGISDGCTLISGLMGKTEMGGITIIHPYISQYENPNYDMGFVGVIKEDIEYSLENNENTIEYSLEEKTIIIPPSTNFNCWMLGEDCFIGSKQIVRELKHIRRTGNLYEVEVWHKGEEGFDSN